MECDRYEGRGARGGCGRDGALVLADVTTQKVDRNEATPITPAPSTRTPPLIPIAFHSLPHIMCRERAYASQQRKRMREEEQDVDGAQERCERQSVRRTCEERRAAKMQQGKDIHVGVKGDDTRGRERSLI